MNNMRTVMAYLTTKEAAEMIGVDESTIRAYMKSGKLIGKRVGEGNRATWLVNPISVEQFIQSGGRSPRGKPSKKADPQDLGD